MKTKGEKRKEQIVTIALALAEKKGYLAVTQQDIAKKAKTCRQLVVNYVGNMKEMQAFIMKEAIKRKMVSVVAQGVVMKQKGMKIPKSLKPEIRKHMSLMVG